MVQPENAHCNLFKAGKYSQITYRLFVCMTPTPDRLSLCQAEWSVRKKAPNSLVHLKGNELWTFSLDDAKPPEPDEKYDLKETATGLFMPSTLASGDITQHALYASFLAAVRQMILQGVMAATWAVPFGVNSVISMGRILHLEPILSPVGDLYLRVYYETTGLVRLQPCDDVQMFNLRVFLAPSSRVGEYLGPVTTPPNVAHFCQMLETTTCVDFTSSVRNYKFKDWISVRIENGKIVSWPLELTYWQPICQKRDEGEFEWFSVKDVFVETEAKVKNIRNTKPVAKVVPVSQKSVMSAPVPQHQQQQAPPQPTRVQNQTQHQNQHYNETNSNGNVYPTPPDPQTKREDNAWSATPGMNEDWDMDADLLGDTEITEADFNFFDEPNHDVELEEPTVKMEDDVEVEVEKEEKQQEFEEKAKAEAKVQGEGLSTKDFTPDMMRPLPTPQSEENGMFAPLKFNPLIAKVLDSKYMVGGKFYVPDPTSVESSDEESSSDESDIDVKMAEPTQNATPINSPEKPAEDYSSSWISILTSSADTVPDPIESTMEPPTPSGISNYDNYINILMQQIVWDNGLLKDFIPGQNGLKSPDSVLVKRLNDYFPGIEKYTLKKVMELSDSTTQATQTTNAPPAVSHMGTPRLDSEDRNEVSQTPRKEDTTTPITEDDTSNAPPQQPQTPFPVPRPPTSSLFPIDVPFFNIIRSQQIMNARAPILKFWKVFGLSPKFGAKNCATALFVPSGLAKSSSATAFVNFLKSTYEGSGLGEMKLGHGNGVVPYDCEFGTVDSAMEGLRIASNQFGTLVLENLDFKNVVVVIATPFHQVAQLIQVIRVFSDLKDLIQNANPKINVDLQIVQVDQIASKNTVIIPSQHTMVRLCLSLYDKCIVDPSDEPLEVQRSEPAFTLARVPSKIQLKFSPLPSKSLIDEDTLMHVAYSVSKDKRWVAVAWTDQWGNVAKVEAMGLKRTGSRPRAFEQVCQEIWDKTITVMNRIPVKWRVALAKVGGKMHEEEMEVWKALAENSTDKVNYFYFLTVDTSPPLVVTGDANLFPHGKCQKSNKRQRGDNGTPITPQPQDSPDMYSSSTPQSQLEDRNENEDSVIVDVMDTTYGVVLPNRIGVPAPNQNDPKTVKPLIAGFLLKPGKNANEPEQRVMEMTLVHCPTTLEGSMKSLLQHYRRLAALGGYTGVSENTGIMLPWHVEAVEKMQRTLAWVE